MKTIPIESDEHWHTLRAANIGSSEAAALFNRSPYETRFSLWQQKAGKIPAEGAENNRMWLGKRLEPVVAERVSELMRWKLEARKVYCVADDVPGAGCTVDFHIVDHEAGPGIVEVKVVDYAVWAENWTDTRAPGHIELQLQHQFMVTGFRWGAIVALILGYVNDVKIYERETQPKAVGQIAREVEAFWQSIRAGASPDPFGAPVEDDAIKALCNPPDPKVTADLTGDEEAFELARQFEWAKKQLAFHAPIAEAARLKLLARFGKAERIVLPGFDVRRNKLGSITKCARVEGVEPVFAPPPAVI